MTQFKWSSLSFTQKFFDLGILTSALALAVALWQPAQSAPFHATRQEVIVQIALFCIVLMGWNTCLSSLALYGSRRLTAWYNDLGDVLRAVGLCSITLAASAHLFHWRLLNVRPLLTFWLIASFSLFVFRLSKRVILREVRLRERNLRHVLIVGAGARGQRIAEVINDHPELGYHLLGFVDNQKVPGLVGKLEDFAQILARNIVDEVMIALPVKSFYAEINQVIQIAEEQGIVVRLHAELFNHKLARARAEQLDEVPVLTLYTAPPSDWRAACKRALDLVGAAALLIVFSPLLLLIAVVIRLTSPGPALFVQERLGLNKQRFPMFKFRTMVTNAEALQQELEQFNEAGGPVFKMRHDPRITPLGRFLRKTSLDELPQLINVVRGELSLVGPRPLPLRDYERFDAYWFNRRFSVKPGITCIWQTSGRSQTTFDQWIKQDLEYIDRWSLALDLKILLKTIPAVLRGTGAM
jgi:exopolysaccharide biosynthesis polyprenyl glycosylphosphotransferase